MLTSIVVLFQDTEYYDVHRLSSPSLLAQLQMFHHYMPSRDGWKEKEREREGTQWIYMYELLDI